MCKTTSPPKKTVDPKRDSAYTPHHSTGRKRTAQRTCDSLKTEYTRNQRRDTTRF
jgi:hypothetical protein